MSKDIGLEEISEYVQGYNPDQLDGLVNNIKGIYHEIAFVEAENSDGNDIEAVMHEETNHPGSDVKLVNTETGEVRGNF